MAPPFYHPPVRLPELLGVGCTTKKVNRKQVSSHSPSSPTHPRQTGNDDSIRQDRTAGQKNHQPPEQPTQSQRDETFISPVELNRTASHCTRWDQDPGDHRATNRMAGTGQASTPSLRHRVAKESRVSTGPMPYEVQYRKSLSVCLVSVDSPGQEVQGQTGR